MEIKQNMEGNKKWLNYQNDQQDPLNILVKLLALIYYNMLTYKSMTSSKVTI